ncbi:DNA polymerase IV 2 [Capnocytophaga canimorsus]|uniref:DNA polymerase IV n=1 Tax=Capnocytophaga canimorsus TaxID=28188 RepID=A0A0B7H5A7_9FLAO|nr:DNA polymerase IV [Capnocytophaga canimorsus]ATA77559.1 DNA polymerase IV [Capnocytophaga canimorsus]PJI82542.1 DNA polymerase-4 [Capnocytophaga canimorsus]CEN33684.1 DNA polymerase IV 2 [Capnocytophaga canimorsus]STA72831.1 DNA polymerase IV [Capnocytophaga canimorsus]
MQPSENPSLRKIIHIDMDAFFASVEQLDFPHLKGKPIAVGGGKERGVIAAASYEARKFGVRSAMSGVIAKKRCPELIFMPPRFERYRQISQQIREIFYQYTDLVEPLSLDEAYLDVTHNKKNCPSATLIATEIRQKIYEKTGLTASAGISINKFVAKIASDFNKPNGQKTVSFDEVQDFLDVLDVKRFYGIGKVTTEKMYLKGIFTGKDLRNKSLSFLEEHFGNHAIYYYQLARGIHLSEVKPLRLPKSVGAERTFSKNITSEVFMEKDLYAIAQELHERMAKKGVLGKTITLKIKYSDFSVQTRSKTFPYQIAQKVEIFHLSKELLYQQPLENSVRLLGISISNLNNKSTEKTKNKQKYIQLEIEFPKW